MQKWEYLVVQSEEEGIIFNAKVLKVNGEGLLKQPKLYVYIKELGQQGWELVSVSKNTLYFKRLIPINSN